MIKESEEQIKCPYCLSTRITSNEKGFSVGKAAVGGLLFGGLGILAGVIGSSKVKITCLNCGNEFNPGEVISDTEIVKILENEGYDTAVDDVSYQCNVSKELGKIRVEQVLEEHGDNIKIYVVTSNERKRRKKEKRIEYGIGIGVVILFIFFILLGMLMFPSCDTLCALF